MSDLSIELYSTENSYTFPFNDTSLDSVALNPLDMLPRQYCRLIVNNIVYCQLQT